MAKLISVTLVRWIVIYPVDSVIQRLNNWGLIDLSNFPLWNDTSEALPRSGHSLK